ncbi:C40 family peptidase [Paenibacillus gansuensis]|uniref:C40 family peptidase n=1 Tax=Paenibacillus gansuensis TaxID=306542 RepID=A0ABW5PBF6_9BACL
MITRNKFIRTIAQIGLCAAIGMSSLTLAAPHKAEAATSRGDKVISIGKKYLGVRYQFGAPTGTTRTFDCSSFTKYIYKKVGVSLPRISKDQAKKGYKVAKSNLRKGDLVFFWGRNGKGRVAHVAIYAGNNKLLHTYKKGVGVTYSSLNSSYWKKHYVTARRVL